jgi:PAS domain S-box-containing protein
MGTSCFFAIRNQSKISLELATAEASASYNKDLVYRRWSSMHGGTYVPVTETTKPNPYLNNIEERDILSPSGRVLTLMNPAYMTRQVYELTGKKYPLKSHLTSLNPIRSENSPVPWEVEALKSFEKGETEFSNVDILDQEEYFRYMRPLFTEKSCLKCHAAQGYGEGDLIGGISVSVPMEPYNVIRFFVVRTISIAYSIIFAMGIIVLIIIFSMLNRQYHRQAVVEEQLRLQAKLLDSVEQSVIATDFDGKILYWNPYSEKLYGWKKSEAIGLDLMNLIIPEKNRENAAKTSKKIREGKSWSGEVRVKNRSEIILPALLTVSPIYNEMGEITGGISITIDLTEKKKLEAQLQQTQKMEGIGTLAGGIAHDFNNILAPIILHSQMALEDISPDNPLRTSMGEIYMAAKRARDLVKQILTFARKGQDNRIILRASLVIKEAIKFLRSTIPTTVDIRYEDKTEHDAIYANPTQINQIVMNLCTNAAQSMKEKEGVIDVILDDVDINKDIKNGIMDLKKGQYLRVTVKDTGPGIAPEILAKIFEPYFTTKKSGEGTGLGLAIIHGIVKKYEGDIIVKSEPAKGTTFMVYLPLVDEQSIILEETKTDLPKGSERVLFVDDEEAAVTAMKKILLRLGYNAVTTTSSLEALEKFSNSPESFDLVITDMTMPDMTGKKLVKEIKSIRPDIPVILCTGFSDQIDEEEAKKAGIDEYMIKPINMNDIAVAIRKVLETQDKQNSQ